MGSRLGAARQTTVGLVLGMGLALGGCSEGDDGRLDLTAGSSGSDSTGTLTTFQPTTTVDPSATIGDPSSSDGGLDASGSSSDGSSSSSAGSSEGESASTTTGESTTGDEPPTVQATSPTDLATGVAADVAIEVTFSEVMAPATITTNTADESCSGSLQLSSDGFATCVRMAAAPTSGDDQTFVLAPAAALASATSYELRVLGSVTDAGGTPMAADSTTGFVVRYFHTIVIDGTNDFGADETFASSTMGHTGYVAWDDAYVYLGMSSPDLGGSSNQVWMVGYLGGAMGSPAGVQYNTQQPLLPFDARWHVRWRASDDFGGALEWSGAAWTNPGFGPTAGSDAIGFGGAFVEMRVAWADLEDPVLLPLCLGMLREQTFNEASWAAVPSGAYVDAYDPDFVQSFEFDVLGSTVPADHAPI